MGKTSGEDGFTIKICNWATAERKFETETKQISALSHLSRMAGRVQPLPGL